MKLNEIMKKNKIKTADLAEKTGIPATTISEYRGNRNRKKEPSFSRGMLIADAIGIDPHELIEDDKKRSYFVANDNGDLAGHDLDIYAAENCLAVMKEQEPDAGWEILSDDSNEE